MIDGAQTRIENFKITASTSLDDLLTAARNSAEAPLQVPDPSDPASANPAVARCCQAYGQALKTARYQGKGEYASARDARQAYRSAMPSLSGPENIRDFIACVAHGMLIEAIEGSAGARLLYAAQVAHGAISRPSPAKVGRPLTRLLPEDNPSPYPEN